MESSIDAKILALEEKYQAQVVAGENPMKWPSFELLGGDLAYLAKKVKESNGRPDQAGKIEHLMRIIESPCYATIKLDGTNVGGDNAGLVVGRNTVIKAGESYQKCPIHDLTKGYGERVEEVFNEI